MNDPCPRGTNIGPGGNDRNIYETHKAAWSSQLDIPSRTRFEQALAQFRGRMLAVVHIRYFLVASAAQIWEVFGG